MNYSQSRIYEDDKNPALRHRFEYKVRVRGPVFLWGSAGIQTNTTYPSALLLHIANDKHGEVITFGTQAAPAAGAPASAPVPIGTLKPGECFSVSIQGISGVLATCNANSQATTVQQLTTLLQLTTVPDLESTVYCVLGSH